MQIPVVSHGVSRPPVGASDGTLHLAATAKAGSVAPPEARLGAAPKASVVVQAQSRGGAEGRRDDRRGSDRRGRRSGKARLCQWKRCDDEECKDAEWAPVQELVTLKVVKKGVWVSNVILHHKHASR